MNTELAASRSRAMLQTAMGPAIASALADPEVIEIMINPDGLLWIDKLGQGRSSTGVKIAASQAERIIRLVASHARGEVNAACPIISSELPPHGDGAGERFEGILPPVAQAPCFAIRKPAQKIYTLDDYVRDKIMPAEAAQLLREAVALRRNMIVAGGTSSGKTTLTNALLAEMAGLGERIILIEDTRELRCGARDVVALRTKMGTAGGDLEVNMRDLVRSTMRLRPDRIIVGEVRGREALDMLKAWNTGHPGGISTLHANGALAALYRLELLIQEAVVSVPRSLIAEAVNLIIFISGRGRERRLERIMRVDRLDAAGEYSLFELFSTSR